jgi:hypothetical protein
MAQNKGGLMVDTFFFCSQRFLMFEVDEMPSSSDQIVHDVLILICLPYGKIGGISRKKGKYCMQGTNQDFLASFQVVIADALYWIVER